MVICCNGGVSGVSPGVSPGVSAMACLLAKASKVRDSTKRANIQKFTILSACADSHAPTIAAKKDKLCPGYYLHTSSDIGAQKHTRMHIRGRTSWVT